MALTRRWTRFGTHLRMVQERCLPTAGETSLTGARDPSHETAQWNMPPLAESIATLSPAGVFLSTLDATIASIGEQPIRELQETCHRAVCHMHQGRQAVSLLRTWSGRTLTCRQTAASSDGYEYDRSRSCCSKQPRPATAYDFVTSECTSVGTRD